VPDDRALVGVGLVAVGGVAGTWLTAREVLGRRRHGTARRSRPRAHWCTVRAALARRQRTMPRDAARIIAALPEPAMVVTVDSDSTCTARRVDRRVD